MMIKFAVHTNHGVFVVQAATPDEARKIVRNASPGVIITKTKRKG